MGLLALACTLAYITYMYIHTYIIYIDYSTNGKFAKRIVFFFFFSSIDTSTCSDVERTRSKVHSGIDTLY